MSAPRIQYCLYNKIKRIPCVSLLTYTKSFGQTFNASRQTDIALLCITFNKTIVRNNVFDEKSFQAF